MYGARRRKNRVLSPGGFWERAMADGTMRRCSQLCGFCFCRRVCYAREPGLSSGFPQALGRAVDAPQRVYAIRSAMTVELRGV